MILSDERFYGSGKLVGSLTSMRVSRGPGPGSLPRLGPSCILALFPWQREAVSRLGVKLIGLGSGGQRQEAQRRSVAEAQLCSGSPLAGEVLHWGSLPVGTPWFRLCPELYRAKR